MKDCNMNKYYKAGFCDGILGRNSNFLSCFYNQSRYYIGYYDGRRERILRNINIEVDYVC